MTVKKQQITRGITLRPDDVALEGISGELKVGATSQKIEAYLNGAAREVITADQTQTLTNKTIDADNNTISNLEVDNLKSGVLNTDAALSGASDTQVPSALAAKDYADSVGSTAQTNLDNHVNDTTDAHDASAISSVPAGNLAATDVQAALNELQSDVDTRATATALTDHISDASDAHDASAISSVPAGNLAATDVQGALNELQSDVDTRALDSALTAHTGASTGVHGVTGAVVGTTDTQTLSAKTLTAPVLNSPSVVTPSRLDVKQDTKANLDTYADTADAGQLTYATDQKKFYGVVDNDLKSLGGGSQGLDTFVQLYADEQVTDWATGDNATFLGGGTLAGTFARVTSGQLNGDASYRYTQAASSLDDYLASPIQAVPVRFRGQTVTASMFYNYDGANSDIEFLVWDVTNSVRLTETTANRLPAASGSIWKVNLAIPASCTQIRVGFQVKALNSTKILNFDDIEISANTAKYVDPSVVTDWQSYTPTYIGFGTVSASEMQWRRVGSDIEIRGKFTSGTHTAVEARIGLPNGYTSAGTAVIGSLQLCGTLAYNANTPTSFYTLIEPSVTYLTLSGQSNTGNALTKILATSVSGGQQYSIVAKVPIAGLSASNPQIITASESFSTDTAQLTYAGSGTYTLTTLADAPVGTFITFTYAAGGNVRTQTTTAPTQTTSDMNVNGMFITNRVYASSSTAALPAAFAIQIGKGMKGVYTSLYKSTGKSIAGSTDIKVFSVDAVQNGLYYNVYNELTGVLILDAGVCQATTITTNAYSFSDISQQSSGYLVINASKSPALVGVPQLQQRIATLSDVKAANTAAGTFTSGAWQTRTLNTLVDSTAIVTSLSSNQFTLAAGTYYIEAIAPAYQVVRHQAKLRNITDSTDALIGTSQITNSTDTVTTVSKITGEVVITSSKIFELQHQCQTTVATQGFGVPANFAVNEVYSIVKITRAK